MYDNYEIIINDFILNEFRVFIYFILKELYVFYLMIFVFKYIRRYEKKNDSD